MHGPCGGDRNERNNTFLRRWSKGQGYGCGQLQVETRNGALWQPVKATLNTWCCQGLPWLPQAAVCLCCASDFIDCSH